MKRNALTTIDQLQVGDRFYKQSDKGKNKSVFQVMDTEKQIRTSAQKYFACPVSSVGGSYESQKTVPFASNFAVIYLLSTGKEVCNG